MNAIRLTIRREIKKHMKRFGELGMIRGFEAPLSGGCLFIKSDPLVKLRAGKDPHCGKPRVEGKPYCAKHLALCTIPGKQRESA